LSQYQNTISVEGKIPENSQPQTFGPLRKRY